MGPNGLDRSTGMDKNYDSSRRNRGFRTLLDGVGHRCYAAVGELGFLEFKAPGFEAHLAGNPKHTPDWTLPHMEGHRRFDNGEPQEGTLMGRPCRALPAAHNARERPG